MSIQSMMRKIYEFEFKGRRVMTIFVLLVVIISGILGFFLLPDQWSDVRRIASGIIGGLGAALIIITSRWIGAYSDTQE